MGLCTQGKIPSLTAALLLLLVLDALACQRQVGHSFPEGGGDVQVAHCQPVDQTIRQANTGPGGCDSSHLSWKEIRQGSVHPQASLFLVFPNSFFPESSIDNMYPHIC